VEGVAGGVCGGAGEEGEAMIWDVKERGLGQDGEGGVL
jgi:hypothetical protein